MSVLRLDLLAHLNTKPQSVEHHLSHLIINNVSLNPYTFWYHQGVWYMGTGMLLTVSPLEFSG